MSPYPFELPDGTVVEIEFRDRSVGCVYAHGLHGYTHGPEKNDATSMVQWGDVRVLRVMAPVPERMDVREAGDVLAKAAALIDADRLEVMARAAFESGYDSDGTQPEWSAVSGVRREVWIDQARAALKALREWEARP